MVFFAASVLLFIFVDFFTPFLKETFISEATWLKVTWRRSVAYTGQHSSCACQLGRAPRFCSLTLPCYPPSFVFQLKLRALEDIMPLYILTDGQYLPSFWTFSNLIHEPDELDVANVMLLTQVKQYSWINMPLLGLCQYFKTFSEFTYCKYQHFSGYIFL